MNNEIIRIGHGSGGRLSRDLIKEVFVKHFTNKTLDGLNDASWITPNSEKLAYTTDSYVIDPIFFPGSDIGQLAVSGTINDLAVSGAIPRYLSAGFIIEEGFPIQDLNRIAASMATEAKAAGVEIITGDTKVVKRGQCDKVFINTSGIGIIPNNRLHLQKPNIEPGDKILVSGTLGDHAIAILTARENLTLDEEITSDAAALNAMIDQALESPTHIKKMRDITRGGLATVLVELTENENFGIMVHEKQIPVRKSVQSVCELFGFDPMYLANEGKILLIVKNGTEEAILHKLRNNRHGSNAVLIGQITDSNPGKAVMQSTIGGKRIIDMLSGELLPRIC